MPVGIKDLIETYDMPTEFGSELFKGHQPMTDAACVRALRLGGAVLVGKTVTVCFGGGDPARTRNPFDTRRTPGGSSSGTAAAVASRMLPVALGTHARGSTIRPASFCGTYALKPTFGAINRQGSFSMAYSMDHLGVFAGTLSDMWTTARFIASEAGGDPGYPGLDGALSPPAPRKPARLIRLDTAGWPVAEPAAKAAFEAYLLRLADAGVEIITRRDDPAIEAYETALAGMPQLWTNLYRFEMHWPMLQYRERYRGQAAAAPAQGHRGRRPYHAGDLSRGADRARASCGRCTTNWHSAPTDSSRCRRPGRDRSAWTRAARSSTKHRRCWARRPSTCPCSRSTLRPWASNCSDAGKATSA